ncbi:hypothetical protein EK904_002988 [Melospiza melodia maxima]|nr:hypothetical protein EK904_002988 [Melospiza melodia maxima]
MVAHDELGGLLPIKRTIRVIDAQNQHFREQEVSGTGGKMGNICNALTFLVVFESGLTIQPFPDCLCLESVEEFLVSHLEFLVSHLNPAEDPMTEDTFTAFLHVYGALLTLTFPKRL